MNNLITDCLNIVESTILLRCVICKNCNIYLKKKIFICYVCNRNVCDKCAVIKNYKYYCVNHLNINSFKC